MNNTIKYYMLYALLCITLNAKCMSFDHNSTRPTTPDYDKIVNDRIKQELKGEALLTSVNDGCHFLLTKLAYGNRLDLLQKLFDHDPSIVKDEECSRAIDGSISNENYTTTKWFLQNGVDPNVRKISYTPLYTICNYGRKLFLIKLFLLYNANPNLQEDFGLTPLHQIFLDAFQVYRNKPGHAQTSAATLIIGGADITIKTFNNWVSESKNNEKTAIEITQREGKSELAKHIKRIATLRDTLFAAVQHGENLNFLDQRFTEIPFRHVRDIDGHSLLHYAIKYKNKAIAKKLIYYWPELYFQPNFNNEYIFQEDVSLLPAAVERLNNPSIEHESTK